MKIAFLHQPWNQIVPDNPQGSVPIWTAEVAKRLSQGHEIYVYSRKRRGPMQEELHGNLRYVRICSPVDPWVDRFVLPVLSVGRTRCSRMSSPLYFRRYYAMAAEHMARESVDVVHVHSFPQAACIIRSIYPTVKIVVHLHVEWLNLLPESVATRQIQDADLVLGCSEYISDKMRQALPAYSAKIRTVYNAVDVETFYEKERPNSQLNRERKILMVGRISPEKGVHTLLDGLHTLIGEEHNIRLEIIGPDWVVPKEVIVDVTDSKLVSQLKPFYRTTLLGNLCTWLKKRYPRRFRSLRDRSYGGFLRAMVKGKLADHVRFVGFIPNGDLPRWYRDADLLVLPSVYETFGIPLIEAMASGTPVVATRIGGVPEIVDDGRVGILVEPGSAAQLAQGIRTLIRDDNRLLQMGKEGRKRVIEKFSWDKAVSTLMDYYNEVLLTPTVPHCHNATSKYRVG